jgi:sortase A
LDGVKLAPPRRLEGPTPGSAPKPGGHAAAAALLPRTAVAGRGFGGGHRPGAQRLLRGLAIFLGVVGLLALSDGVITLVWQEPVSGLLAHISQGQLAKSLDRLERQRPTVADEHALDGLPTDEQRMAYFARNLQQTAAAGQAVGRIVIPRIGADYVVVAGTSESSLKKGPGIYSGTSVPGLSGTVGIAGHRTTYLAPFRRINELTKGDLVTLQMPYGIFTYTVTGHKIVAPNNTSVLAPTGYDQVVLTACNPLYSASQRLAVFARLTSSVPSGLALSTSVPQVSVTATPAIGGAQFVPSLLGAPLPTSLAPFASVGGSPSTSSADGIVVGPTTVAAQRALAGPPPRAKKAAGGLAGSAASPSTSGSTAPALRTTPVSSAPRQPIRVTPTVRPRQPVESTKPASSSPKPKSSSTPTDVTGVSPTTTTGQTRVQGQPGGPAPIIVGSTD